MVGYKKVQAMIIYVVSMKVSDLSKALIDGEKKLVYRRYSQMAANNDRLALRSKQLPSIGG
jgi:hypothetical protein